jgi:hypothetical protein
MEGVVNGVRSREFDDDAESIRFLGCIIWLTGMVDGSWAFECFDDVASPASHPVNPAPPVTVHRGSAPAGQLSSHALVSSEMSMPKSVATPAYQISLHVVL